MSDVAGRFQEYVATLSAEGQSLQEVSEPELQLALVLMLVQVLRADMQIRDEEVQAVAGALREILGVGRDEATDLMRVAAESARDSERMRRAVERLDRQLSRGQRRQLLEWLWRIALADAEVLGPEEYLIRKISELLRLATADIIEAKVRAKETFGAGS
jgi:uncharacterized tellurite resistance protein B-like protein